MSRSLKTQANRGSRRRVRVTDRRLKRNPDLLARTIDPVPQGHNWTSPQGVRAYVG